MIRPTFSPAWAHFVYNEHAKLDANRYQEAAKATTDYTYVDDLPTSQPIIESTVAVNQQAITSFANLSFAPVSFQSIIQDPLKLSPPEKVETFLVSRALITPADNVSKILGRFWDTANDLAVHERADNEDAQPRNHSNQAVDESPLDVPRLSRSAISCEPTTSFTKFSLNYQRAVPDVSKQFASKTSTDEVVRNALSTPEAWTNHRPATLLPIDQEDAPPPSPIHNDIVSTTHCLVPSFPLTNSAVAMRDESMTWNTIS